MWHRIIKKRIRVINLDQDFEGVDMILLSEGINVLFAYAGA